jgi:ABC-type sugar transport system ATPase subunit
LSTINDVEKPAAIIQMRAIRKVFDATRAVDGVDIDLLAGEIHGLIGENGAGKSTLMRILAGSFSDYQGTITVGGIQVRLTSPSEAKALGIALVHQELSLLPERTVAENIFLGREPPSRIPGFISRRPIEAATRIVLQECGVGLNPSTQVGELSIAQRQLVEIAKGVAGAPRVLILDEPTSSLSLPEIRELFTIVRRLAARGTAIVYISHKLNEMFELTDRITVLRDGRKVASQDTSDWTESALVRAMVGRDLSALFPHTPAAIGSTRLEVKNLSRPGVFGPVSLAIRSGEIVGLYGIVGAGRSEFAEALFGLTPADSGEILVDGERIFIGSPNKALAAGIAMSPEDRRTRGLVSMLSVSSNISLGALGKFSTAGFVDRRRERRSVGDLLRRLLVRAQSPAQEVSSLSGGNQQKVVIGRSLISAPRVLVLDEPTRGIDVVAKAEVHGTIDRLAHDGLAVLLISSELPEILGMSDRILVMRRGIIVGDVKRADATEENLVAMAAGANQ